MRLLEALEKAETLSELVAGAPAILLTMKGIESWVESSTKLVPDSKIAAHPELLPEWSIGERYAAGDRVQLSGRAWKALQSHTAAEELCPIHEDAADTWRQIL